MAYTVDVYVENQAAPGVWTLVEADVPAAEGTSGWLYDAPGTYRFRVELFEDGAPVDTSYTNWVTVGRSRMLTPAIKALLAGRQMAVRAWVFVENADGEQIDRSDYLTGFEVSYHRDQFVGSATVQIRREHGALSLSPEIDASPLNQKRDGTYGKAIDLGRNFTIWIYQGPPDSVPVFDSEYTQLLFCGYIKGHDFAKPDASFHGLDMHGRLASRLIEEERVYGAPSPGVPLQDVVQQLFDDNYPNTGVYVPFDIDVEVRLKTQEKGVYLLETARWWALQGAADLRGLWRDETGVFTLTLYQPDRTATEPVYVFGKDEWLEVATYRKEDANIRNVALGSYVDDVGVQHVMEPVVDPVSVGKYDRLAMIFDLGTDSLVRTDAGWTTLATGAVLDLSEPDADMEIRTVFFWPVGLNRMYGFQADGARFAEQRNFACIGYRHVYRAGQGHMADTWETYLSVRGKPAAAQREYIQRENLPTPETPNAPAPPPDAAAMLFYSFNATLLDNPPPNIRLEWTLGNPDITHTISIDEDKEGIGAWFEVVTGIAITGGFDTYDHVIAGTAPTQVRYRIRTVGATTTSRVSGTIPIP